MIGLFCHGADSNLKLQEPPNKAAPQDHSGLTGVLGEVSMRLHNAEVLCPVVAAHRKADTEVHGWERLPPTAHQVIFAASAASRLTILSAFPLAIHHFLNMLNATALQSDCALTYSQNNIFLPTALCQALLQGHILAMYDPDALTGFSLILALPSQAGPANVQQREMRVQVLLVMG